MMKSTVEIVTPDQTLYNLLQELMQDMQALRVNNDLLEDRFKTLIEQHERILTLLDEVTDLRMQRIKIPHRCPICNGSSFDEEGALCHPCEGRGIVWG